ncbi:MAG: DNA recombination protein RmuC [Bauldia sp.]
MPTLEIVLFGTVAVLALAVGLLILAWRMAAKRTATEEAKYRDISSVIEQRLGEVARIQSEMKGGVQAMAEAFGSRQAEIAHGLGERMDGLSQRINTSMGETTRTTFESLSKLQERLAIIDSAQRTITDLSKEVVGLQHILADKQQRGAFGQARMEAIVQDGLPVGAYSFQETLSNGKRPDCVVKLPNGAPRIVIDAKFPLEAWNAMRAATLAGHSTATAQTLFRRDVSAHVRAIRERYFIAGETQDTAIMFVPSESIFADIHEHFPDLIQEAYRNRVVIVSPSLLMLSIQVMQAILKDARMREQADLIRNQVISLIKDVARLDKRARELQQHFGQASRDVDQILISTGKIVTRGERITAVEISEDAPPIAPTPMFGPAPHAAAAAPGLPLHPPEADLPAAGETPPGMRPAAVSGVVANGAVGNGAASGHDLAATLVTPPVPPPTAGASSTAAAKQIEELFADLPPIAVPPRPASPGPRAAHPETVIALPDLSAAFPAGAPAAPAPSGGAKLDSAPRGAETVEKLIAVLTGVPPVPAGGERAGEPVVTPPPRPPIP